jgi:hypothetical protein
MFSVAQSKTCMKDTGPDDVPPIERTIEVARQAGAFGVGPLRAALDSSP